MEEKFTFLKEEWFMWLMLVIFAPVGIFLMWKYNEKLEQETKNIIAGGSLVLFILIWVPIFVNYQNNTNTQKAEKIAAENKQVVQEDEEKAAADKAVADKAAADKAIADKAAAEAAKPKQILGSTKDQVKELLKAYKINTAYQNNVDPNAIKFEDKNYIIVVEFDSNSLAEGVSYLSFDGAYSGKGSYVDLNYDKIISFATGGGNYPIANNVNPDVGFEYPTEIYIGTMHR